MRKVLLLVRCGDEIGGPGDAAGFSQAGDETLAAVLGEDAARSRPGRSSRRRR